MTIEQVVLEGAGFERTALEWRTANVVFGRNNAGKSRLLDFVVHLLTASGPWQSSWDDDEDLGEGTVIGLAVGAIRERRLLSDEDVTKAAEAREEQGSSPRPGWDAVELDGRESAKQLKDGIRKALGEPWPGKTMRPLVEALLEVVPLGSELPGLRPAVQRILHLADATPLDASGARDNGREDP